MRKRKCGKAARCPGLYGCEHSENCVRKKTKVHTAPRQNNEHHSMYHGKTWSSLRAIVLSRMPICASCYAKGFITPASHVDHIRRFNNDRALFIKLDNLQPLCHGKGTNNCHTRKTNAENLSGQDYLKEWDFSEVVKKYADENE